MPQSIDNEDQLFYSRRMQEFRARSQSHSPSNPFITTSDQVIDDSNNGPGLTSVTKTVKTRLTISEDQSAGSKHKDQILSLAFKSKEVQSKALDDPHEDERLSQLQFQLLQQEGQKLLQQEGQRQHQARQQEARLQEKLQRQLQQEQQQQQQQHHLLPPGLYTAQPQNIENMSMQSEPETTLPSTSVYIAPPPPDNKSLGLENLTAENGELLSDNVQDLQEYIRSLKATVQSLRDSERQQEPSKIQRLYRVIKPKKTTTFFDQPEWTVGENRSRNLSGTLPLASFPHYLQMNKNIAFVVFRDFDINELEQRLDGTSNSDSDDFLPPISHTSESIYPASKDLSVAIISILDSRSEFSDLLESFKGTYSLTAPYLFRYHSRDFSDELVKSMTERGKRQLSILSGYIDTEFKLEYEKADDLLSRGRISMAYVQYLFKPNDILVKVEEGKSSAYVSKSWPLRSHLRDSSDSHARVGGKKAFVKSDNVRIWDIAAWSWAYNGTFHCIHENLSLQLLAHDEEEQEIEKLNVCPLKYVSHKIVEMLEQRGRTFWKCRFGHLVSYRKDDKYETQNSADERYMIDHTMYRKLHPKGRTSDHSPEDELPVSAMSQSEPPMEKFCLLLPPTLQGYNLRRKKWLDIQADRITEVSWNKEAFKSLVVDRKTKDLIQALVSNQLAAEKSTDLISGKGNGLILLLHGGPGTGKTLTAESVAETAERPLYRVTCGDIGTEPEAVEKYLESVLNLGKVWGCVVLLDEADIFLEERGREDLKRNALVSVFLRVLEYYDGILILTSNRVGIFDEAFKSRIQLALHYADLDSFQRHRIWENFIRRLESLGEVGIDFPDLEDHLRQLAEEKMNGRQIRNAITTARQYAKWKGETLKYEQLKDVIEISGRFDKYIDKLNRGYTQDQLAEEDGLRLSKAP